MLKKIVIIILILAFPLTACSVLQSAQAIVQGSNPSSQNSGQNSGQNTFAGITANTPIDSKLAIGILKLEGTNQAVTPAEAKNMVPLWQALKTLSTSPTTAPEEVTAVFQQIQDTLTPEQVQAVKQMAVSQADLQALEKTLGIQPGQGGGFGGGATQSPAQQATRSARQTQNPGGNGGGFGGPGGGFGGNGGGFGGPGGGTGGTGNQGSTTTTRPTSSPAQLIRRSMGMNLIFMDPLIKLLEQRAGS